MDISHILSVRGRVAVKTAPSTSIEDAAHEMAETKLSYLVVCQPDDTVVGVLSERDVIRGLADFGAAAVAMSVDKLMTKSPVTCRPTDKPQDVLNVMNARGFRHMPVVEDGKLTGIVSSRDIIKHLLGQATLDHAALRTLNELGIY